MSEQTVIELQNISVEQKNRLVLANVNLKVKTGDFIYLIGKTGSGKSSLLQILYADLAVEDGSANVCGYNLREINRNEIVLNLSIPSWDYFYRTQAYLEIMQEIRQIYMAQIKV